MVLLSTGLMPLAVLGSWKYITERERGYYALMLTLTTGMLGRFRGARSLRVLRVLGVMLIPMYFIIGVWGGKQPTLRGHQVLHLHHPRLAAHAGGDPGAWYGRLPRATGTVSFAYADLLEHSPQLGTLAPWLFARLLPGLRDQSADVPVPHLATGRARRGAHRWQRDPGQHPAQDGDLRLPSVCRAVLPRGGTEPRRHDDRAGLRRWSASSMAPSSPWSSRT